MTGHRLSNNEYLGVSNGKANYFEIQGRAATGANASKSTEDFNAWKDNAINLGDYKVIPFGTNNDIPNELQETIFPNHLAPGVLDRKVELLFGQGPYLYQLKPDGKQFSRIPVEDANIQAWLDSIDYETSLIKNATEYYYAEQIYTKIRRGMGARIGRTDVSAAGVETLSNVNCRLAYKRSDAKKTPTHVIVGDWKNSTDKKDFEVFPIWDKNTPDRYPISIHITGFKSFGLPHYVLPSIYGTLNWIRRSTIAPKIIEAFTNNSLNIRFHITSPQKFWDDQREIMMKNCTAQKIKFTEKMMQDLEDKIFDGLSDVLSGVENVGKFWHNKTVQSFVGGKAVEEGWKISPIKQEVKEYVDAQIAVANKSDFAVQAGLRLHAALAFVGADGKSDSGSEQLYAYLIHQLTALPIAELFVCKALNDLIKHKFNTNIRVGFYQVQAQKQEDTSESKRVKNTTV
jgi:hypothetical protein